MTNSRVKKAIDETIGNKPLMNEAFVQKVMAGKKKRKKRVPFFQPALVVVLMLLIGAVLYFTPQEHQAVQIESQYLSEPYEKLIGQYYAAISKQDKKALAQIAQTNADEAFSRYSTFDLTGPLHVLKHIEAGEEIKVFMKLPRSNGEELIDTLVINKATKKLEVDALQTMKYYVEAVELPRVLVLEYKEAPLAPIMEKVTLPLKDAVIQTVKGYTLYQVPTKEGMWRVLEVPNGQQLDLGKTNSAEPMYMQPAEEGYFYLIDSETLEIIVVYHNKEKAYQIISGKLKYPSLTRDQTDFHELPVIVLGGAEPKLVTIEQGKLLYANAFEQMELVNAPEFYSTEAIGKHLLVIYNEENQQVSSYYQLTDKNTFTMDRFINMLEAKPEHLQDLILQNRYNDSIKYIFEGDTLHYRNDTRIYRERPTAENPEPDSGELVEKTYTNVKIETKNNQYFITADDGFSWTLTRTAPRILQDERGIEYTVPIAFEDIVEMSDVLLEDEIHALRLYKSGGTGMNAYVLEEDLVQVNDLFTQATVHREMFTFEDTALRLEIEYPNGKKVTFKLWLKEDQQSVIMNMNPLENTYTIFKIPEALADHFRTLVKQLDEIDSK